MTNQELEQRLSVTSSIESDVTERRINSIDDPTSTTTTAATTNNNNANSHQSSTTTTNITNNNNNASSTSSNRNIFSTTRTSNTTNSSSISSSNNNTTTKPKKKKTLNMVSLAKHNDAKTVGLGFSLRSTSITDTHTRPSYKKVHSVKTNNHRHHDNNNTDTEQVLLEQGILEQDEAKLRHFIDNKRKWTRFGRDLLASTFAFIMYLITVETILCCATTIGLTIVWFQRYGHGASNTWNGGGMDWVVLGFAVVTPITVTIGLAFRRRELALLHITRLRSCAFQLYLGHALWDWGQVDFNSTTTTTETTANKKNKSSLLQNLKGGRESLREQINWQQHSDKVLEHLVGIGDELSRFLTLPTSSRTNHRMLRDGRREAASIVEVAYRLFDSLYTQRITKLTILTEELKAYGLSPSEASRIRQYERFMGEAVEGLRMIKMYRTPLALRSFGRIFTMVLPPLYSPTFAQLAFDLNSLAFGILFALVTPLCLTALFESMRALEDPFVAWITLDGIDINEEFEVLHFHQLINARMSIYPNAHPFEERSKNAIDIYSSQNGGGSNSSSSTLRGTKSNLFNSNNSTNMMDRSTRSRTSRYSMNGSSHSRNIPSLDGSSRVSHFNSILALDEEQIRKMEV